MINKLNFKQTAIGLIPIDWKTTSVGKLSKFKYGLGESAQETGKYVYLRITDLDSDGGINKKNLKYMDESKVKEKDLLNFGDVLVARTGATYGKTYFFKESFLATYGGFLIKFEFDKSLIDSNYFFQFSRGKMYWNQAKNLVNGGAQPQFNANVLSKLILPLPSLSEQQAIASILSSFDNKIDILEKQNETFENINEALFKYWFINFEFPNDTGKPYKSNGGKMIYDENFGKEIPINWSFNNIEKTTSNILRGFTTKYVEKSNLINLNQKVNRGNLLDKNNFKYYPKDTIVPKNKFAQKWDILINSLGQGTLGRVHLYLEQTNNVVVDQHISIIRSDCNQINPKYLFYYLTFPENNARLMESISGSTGMLMLNISKIRNFKIVIPPRSILCKFDLIITDLLEKKVSNLIEIENLKKTRNLLLPRLMSGKIRLNKAHSYSNTLKTDNKEFKE
jgi:type I restriction enzyme, S subunit